MKTSRTISAVDLRGLQALQGLILYRGQTVVSFGPRLHAVLIDALWRWGAS